MDSTRHTDKTITTREDDDRDELLSSTEVDESLMGDEKQWRSPKRNRFGEAFGRYQWFIDAFLLAVIMGLLVLLWDQRKPSGLWQVGGDFAGAGVKFPTKVIKFEADMEFAPRNMSEFFTDTTLAKWQKLMPAGTGYGSTDRTFFTTSMTHQLHCVYMMARVFSGVMTNNTKILPHDYHHHFLHCVDYLRQGIMCSGDLAMEAHDATDSDDLGPLDGGWSGHHVCKDYNHVINYLEEQIVDGIRVVLPIDD